MFFYCYTFILLNDFYKTQKQDKSYLAAFKEELEYNLKISEANLNC